MTPVLKTDFVVFAVCKIKVPLTAQTLPTSVFPEIWQGKQSGKNIGEEKMATISIADVEPQRKRFKKLAPDKEFEFEYGDGEDHSYVYILRNGDRIGDFKYLKSKNIINFEFYNSHPWGRAHTPDRKPVKIPINKLTDEHIISAIEKTP